MIFKQKLAKEEIGIQKEFTRLLNLALKTQTHLGDLLLIYANGFYDESVLQFRGADGMSLDPHTIGYGNEGWSDQTHFMFIHDYRTKHTVENSMEEYINQITEDAEALSIQMEMLVYLKFWEADLVIKRFYQLVRILSGKSYDWYFKIGDQNRDKENTGTRKLILCNLVRDRLKDFSPILFSTIESAYKPEIRNAIAHSSYFIVGRSIHIQDNMSKNPVNKVLSFDDWYDMFHKTIILHNQYVGMNNDINEYYAEVVSHLDFKFPIRITPKDGGEYELPVQYRQNGNWGY